MSQALHQSNLYNVWVYVTPDEEKDLDDSMAKASQDAEVLKSIILPLEEQIVALKGELRETDSLMQEYERKQVEGLLAMDAVAEWLNGKNKEEVEKKLIEEVGDGYSEESGVFYHAMLNKHISHNQTYHDHSQCHAQYKMHIFLQHILRQ